MFASIGGPTARYRAFTDEVAILRSEMEPSYRPLLLGPARTLSEGYESWVLAPHAIDIRTVDCPWHDYGARLIRATHHLGFARILITSFGDPDARVLEMYESEGDFFVPAAKFGGDEDLAVDPIAHWDQAFQTIVRSHYVTSSWTT